MPRILPIVLLASACLSPLGPFLPPGTPYDPPDTYPTWWVETRDCVGIPNADFDRINWFQVDGFSFDTPDHGRASGRWVAPHDIYIATAHLQNEKVVKHEMIHDLLQGGGTDDPVFERCSGLSHR